MRGETTFWGYGCGRWNTRQLYRVARERVAREKCCYVKPLAGCLAGQTRLDTHTGKRRDTKKTRQEREDAHGFTLVSHAALMPTFKSVVCIDNCRSSNFNLRRRVRAFLEFFEVLGSIMLGSTGFYWTLI